MGRSKSEKRKRTKHKRHSSSGSDSDDSSSGSSSSESDSDSSSSSSGSSEVESHRSRRGEKKKTSKRRRSSDHKKRRTSKHKKKERKIPKIQNISPEDYFLKSSEFRVWLLKERKIYFNDLSSEQSRQLFKKFVSKWNNGLLNRKYYQGIQSSAVGHESQSQYKWKFASGISDDLKAMRSSVSTWSAGSSSKDGTTGKEGKMAATAASLAKPKQPIIGPQRPGSEDTARVIGPAPAHGPHDPYEREERREADRSRFKKERKELRKHHELVMEELVPKATGREAQLEKKKQRAAQRRDKELSPEADETMLMGASNDYVGKKIKKRHDQRQHRAEAASQKIADYQAREQARVTAILEMAKANKKEGAMW